MQSNFQVGDKAVHPAHGVGEVTGIERREIAGSFGSFYVLRILDSGMRVMVPTKSAQALRTLMTSNEANEVMAVFHVDEKAVGAGPWNRRQRAYNDMIKSGSPLEVARVLRDLYRVKFRESKELSYGERRLMDQARSLLLYELAHARNVTEAEVEREIESVVRAA